MKRGKKKESHNHNFCACSKVSTSGLNTFVLNWAGDTLDSGLNGRLFV